jgi:predicted DsbA family dithiol-disulfide isomerase
MIRVNRTTRVSRGKAQQGIQWAREVTEYANKNFPEASAEAYVEIGGNIGTIHWFIDYADLATLERVAQQLAADDGYQAMLRQAADDALFIEGSAHDTFTRSM